jgi:hypothetical protein
MFETDMSNHPEVDLLLREEMEIYNVCEQFNVHTVLFPYNLKLPKCM